MNDVNKAVPNLSQDDCEKLRKLSQDAREKLRAWSEWIEQSDWEEAMDTAAQLVAAKARADKFKESK